jgi:hypothetical protein
MVLTGLRGVGKTVLLNDLADRARRRDWVVAQVEARGDGDIRDASFRSMVARSLNQSLRHVTGRSTLRERLRSALATFKSFSIRTDPSGALALGSKATPSEVVPTRVPWSLISPSSPSTSRPRRQRSASG